jgi:hypothetical protein
MLSELLGECVGQIVRRIRGDQQHGLAMLGQLHGQGAGGRRLAYSGEEKGKKQ